MMRSHITNYAPPEIIKRAPHIIDSNSIELDDPDCGIQIVSSPQSLGVVAMGPCIGVIIHDQSAKTAMGVHHYAPFSGLNFSNSLTELCQRVNEEFRHLRALRVYIGGAHIDPTEISPQDQQEISVNREQYVKAFQDLGIPERGIFKRWGPIGQFAMQDMILELKTGKMTYYEYSLG